MNIKIDINVCRVCLQSTDGISIFNDEIFDKFVFTTLVQVEKNDGLPSILCKKCTAKLRLAYDFKKQTEKSDKHLRSFILDVNKKFQLVTKNDGEPDIDEELNELIDYENESVNEENAKIKPIKTDENNYSVEVEDLAENNEQMVVMIVNEEEVPINEDVCYSNENGQNEYTEIDSLSQINDDSINDLNESVDPLYEEHLESATESESATLESAKSTPKSSKKRKFSKKFDTKLGEHPCDRCNKLFSTRTNLTRHLMTHDGQKPYVCKICGNGFTQNGSLKSHMFIHTGERPFACHLCPKAFTQSKSLVFHMRRHTGEKPFTCSECGMNFRQKDGLKRHEKTKHSSTIPEPLECNYCGKCILSKYSLKIHINRFHADKNDDDSFTQNDDPNKCDICDASFDSKDDLYTHYDSEHLLKISYDAGEGKKANFKCGECGLMFQDVSTMMQHMKKHDHHSDNEETEMTYSIDIDE